jgi:hypothetical protein
MFAEVVDQRLRQRPDLDERIFISRPLEGEQNLASQYGECVVLSRDHGERLGVVIDVVGWKPKDDVLNLCVSVERRQQDPECVTHIGTRSILPSSEVQFELIEERPEQGMLFDEKLGDDHMVALPG